MEDANEPIDTVQRGTINTTLGGLPEVLPQCPDQRGNPPAVRRTPGWFLDGHDLDQKRVAGITQGIAVHVLLCRETDLGGKFGQVLIYKLHQPVHCPRPVRDGHFPRDLSGLSEAEESAETLGLSDVNNISEVLGHFIIPF
ncbi:hypothetical protein MKZ38_002829 [Zalerion maritima]|uniref:Uncharacterized protein n=1 Tax=Zalerion maritima TaxID=339359 RepID=A0AAD5WQJ9_9PEZI|nr:hypothetical protein MKZ38_002829 [Zalerion maritima]